MQYYRFPSRQQGREDDRLIVHLLLSTAIFSQRTLLTASYSGKVQKWAAGARARSHTGRRLVKPLHARCGYDAQTPIRRCIHPRPGPRSGRGDILTMAAPDSFAKSAPSWILDLATHKVSHHGLRRPQHRRQLEGMHREQARLRRASASPARRRRSPQLHRPHRPPSPARSGRPAEARSTPTAAARLSSDQKVSERSAPGGRGRSAKAEGAPTASSSALAAQVLPATGAHSPRGTK